MGSIPLCPAGAGLDVESERRQPYVPTRQNEASAPRVTPGPAFSFVSSIDFAFIQGSFSLRLIHDLADCLTPLCAWGALSEHPIPAYALFIYRDVKANFFI